MARGSDGEGLARASRMEKNNYKSGRTESGTMKLPGNISIRHHNPTSSGGINRPTRGTGAGKKNY